MTDLTGKQVGVYRLMKKLGEGGFAEVYLAENIHVEKQMVPPYAIKILRDTLPEEARIQFKKEADTIIKLRHPHIIKLLYFDFYNNLPFLVMDYIEGGSLRNRYPEGTKLALPTIVGYAKQIASALQHAHYRGIVHRDIKPDNILWEDDNSLLVSDFGIAIRSHTKTNSQQEKVGTLPYMSPEHFQAKAQSASDRYSLAVMVYEWLCGVTPFTDGDFSQMGYQHRFEVPPPLHDKIDISSTIEAVVMTALAKEPKARFADIATFSKALEDAYISSIPVPDSLLIEHNAIEPTPPSLPFVELQSDIVSLKGEEQNEVSMAMPPLSAKREVNSVNAAQLKRDILVKQEDGSELLGENDPRSAIIGIIYVAPNDGRKSILEAILTQEKLGRKQIAIVLPAQNRAFQRSIDFEGLINMRRKLQAQLIIIAPQGSNLADFARQRRFTFFSSLESYERSLRDESDASRSVKRGWFGERGSVKSGSDGRSNGDEEIMPIPSEFQPQEFPVNNDAYIHSDARDNYAHPNPIIPFATGAGAGFIADQELHHPEDDDTVESPQINNSSNFDNDVPDLPLTAPPFPNILDDDEEIQVLPPPPIDYGDDESEIADDIDDDMAGADDDESMPLVAGVPYQAGGVGATRYGATGAALSPIGNTIGRRRSGWQLLLLALIGLFLLSLLLCGGIALAAPGTLAIVFGSLVGGGTPTNAATITPRSVPLSNTYVATSTSGTPDPSKRQIEARRLTFTTQPQTKTVPATGVVKTQGTHATGTITFYNGTTSAYYVAANMPFTDAQGIVITNDGLVAIPAANPSGGYYGKITVSGHAVNVGANGNIPAGDFSNYVCCGSGSVGISTNNAFTGGQDSQQFIAVQQSDVDSAANLLKPALLQAALSMLNGLKHVGEQYVNKPVCTTNVTVNPPVGTKATTVTASVTATCSAEAYDQMGVETIAANLLMAEADKDTGGGYVLSGNIATSLTSVTADSHGNLTLLVKASGTWMYQFTPTVKTSLAKLIAGKTKEQATALLSQQPGIASFTLNIANGNTLPTDYTQINIAVPSVGQGTPTVVSGSATPTHIPAPGTTTPIGGS